MKKILWSLFEMVETVAIAVAIVFVVRSFIAQPFLVSGSSMLPNFHNGDYLLIDELTYRFRTPERGEIIVFKYPGDTSGNSFYIKRVIGLPGETVHIKNGETEIKKADGTEVPLQEEYILSERHATDMEITLKPDEYFVMGDNRGASYDSRSWGALQERYITGIVRLRLWPVDRVMAFSTPTY